MIFLWAFILLCVFTARNTRMVRKLRRRLDSFEVTLRLRDDDTIKAVQADLVDATQSAAAAPLDLKK